MAVLLPLKTLALRSFQIESVSLPQSRVAGKLADLNTLPSTASEGATSSTTAVVWPAQGRRRRSLELAYSTHGLVTELHHTISRR
jgi:hypothetical protein